MSLFFDRNMELIVGPVKIPIKTPNPLIPGKFLPSLRAIFSVDKTSDSTPNKASVSVYNMYEPHRKAITPQFPLVINAGYNELTQLIFNGIIANADSKLEGVNWVSNVEADDVGLLNAYSTARISKSFGPGTMMSAYLAALAVALKVGVGNSIEKFTTSPRNYVVFKRGKAVSGSAVEKLNEVCESVGYRWSIQDGQLQLLGSNEVIMGMAVVLNQGTGLIGTPEKGEKGWIKARSLLNGQICPGRLVQLTSTTATGAYRVDKVKHFGDTWGGDWYSDWEGKPLT